MKKVLLSLYLNTTDFDFEIQRQLSDTTYYIPIACDSTNRITRPIKQVVQGGLALNYITSTEGGYLIN